MATKYYEAMNCNRIFSAGDKEIQFEPTMLLGGVWWGIYATDDKDRQKALKEEPTVTELKKAEYEDAVKKKAMPAADFNPLPTLSSAKAVRQPLTQVEDAGPVQSVLQDKQAREEAVEEVSVDDALSVGPTDRAQSSKRKSKSKK